MSGCGGNTRLVRLSGLACVSSRFHGVSGKAPGRSPQKLYFGTCAEVRYTWTMPANVSTTLPETCLAAVFEAPNTPMRLARVPVPRDLPPGAVLCRVRLSTICGSDLHTTSGRRIEPAPSILGHESVGEVVALGEGARYRSGEPLHLGDRVSWTIMASCGACSFCSRALPQKCVYLKKYGHLPMTVWPGLTGGYAEYIYLFPGTGIFAAPPDLDDAVVAPANCALATVVCALETISAAWFPVKACSSAAPGCWAPTLPRWPKKRARAS